MLGQFVLPHVLVVVGLLHVAQGKFQPLARKHEAEKVFLVNLVKDGGHGLLDNLVFQGGNPQWALPSICFLYVQLFAIVALDTLPGRALVHKACTIKLNDA
jgi:hypothetical protein